MNKLHPHKHAHACDCSAHRAARGTGTDPDTAESAATPSGAWPALLSVLACAVCPACLTTYAKFLSILGVGIELTDAQHTLLLAVALTASVGLSAWRSWRSQRAWPIVLAAIGTSLVVAGHLRAEWHALEWVGVGVLLVGGLTEQLRMRSGLSLPSIGTRKSNAHRLTT